MQRRCVAAWRCPANAAAAQFRSISTAAHPVVRDYAAEAAAVAADAARSGEQPLNAAYHTAGAATAARAAPDAAARGAYSPQECLGAHLAALDSVRLKAYALPEGGIPAEWAGLEPLPPNTKPPPGETNADARRALWRVLNHKEPFACPACRQPIYKIDVLGRHLRACCPDLVSQQARQFISAPDAVMSPITRSAFANLHVRRAWAPPADLLRRAGKTAWPLRWRCPCMSFSSQDSWNDPDSNTKGTSRSKPPVTIS